MIDYQPTLMVMLTLSPQSWNYIIVGPILVLHCDVIITLTLVHIHHINLKKYNFSTLQGFKCFLCLSLEYLLEIVMNKLRSLLLTARNKYMITLVWKSKWQNIDY